MNNLAYDIQKERKNVNRQTPQKEIKKMCYSKLIELENKVTELLQLAYDAKDLQEKKNIYNDVLKYNAQTRQLSLSTIDDIYDFIGNN